MHPKKTKIVNCDVRTNQHAANNQFDFLGFSFRRRGANNTKENKVFTSFLPAVSDNAKKAIKHKIKSLPWLAMVSKGIDNLARVINPYLRGIINYYGKFYHSELDSIWRVLDERIVRWIMRKRKKYKYAKGKAYKLIEEIKSSVYHGGLFAHWQFKLNQK